MTTRDSTAGTVNFEHPSAEDLAAYLSGSLRGFERRDLESHLSVCWLCRQEVIGGQRLLRSRPRGRLWLTVPVAAAAITALLLLRPGPPGRTGDEPLRAGGHIGQESGTRLVVVSPAEGDTVDTGDLSFTWRAHRGEPLYRLTIADRTGRTLWTGDTADTTLAPPASMQLDHGSRYLWYVDALDVEGRSATTGTRSFYAAP
jgi:hypothetical protein